MSALILVVALIGVLVIGALLWWVEEFVIEAVISGLVATAIWFADRSRAAFRRRP